jgi:hypothetical protein
MIKKLGIFAACALLALSLGGCSTQSKVSADLAIIGTVIGLAQSDIPSLVSAGKLSASDGTALGDYLGGADALLGQAQVCVNTLGSGGKAVDLLSCVNDFGVGLLSPSEQADLRLISPAAQSQVTIYVTAIVLADNVAIALLGGTPVAIPVVGSAPAASAADMAAFKVRLHLKKY